MHHRILITLLAAGMLSACGQKGPLYLPDDLPADSSPVEAAGETAHPAPASAGVSSPEAEAASGGDGDSKPQP